MLRGVPRSDSMSSATLTNSSSSTSLHAKSKSSTSRTASQGGTTAPVVPAAPAAPTPADHPDPAVPTDPEAPTDPTPKPGPRVLRAPASMDALTVPRPAATASTAGSTSPPSPSLTFATAQACHPAPLPSAIAALATTRRTRRKPVEYKQPPPPPPPNGASTVTSTGPAATAPVPPPARASRTFLLRPIVAAAAASHTRSQTEASDAASVTPVSAMPSPAPSHRRKPLPASFVRQPPPPPPSNATAPCMTASMVQMSAGEQLARVRRLTASEAEMGAGSTVEGEEAWRAAAEKARAKGKWGWRFGFFTKSRPQSRHPDPDPTGDWPPPRPTWLQSAAHRLADRLSFLSSTPSPSAAPSPRPKPSVVATRSLPVRAGTTLAPGGDAGPATTSASMFRLRRASTRPSLRDAGVAGEGGAPMTVATGSEESFRMNRIRPAGPRSSTSIELVGRSSLHSAARRCVSILVFTLSFGCQRKHVSNRLLHLIFHPVSSLEAPSSRPYSPTALPSRHSTLLVGPRVAPVPPARTSAPTTAAASPSRSPASRPASTDASLSITSAQDAVTSTTVDSAPTAAAAAAPAVEVAAAPAAVAAPVVAAAAPVSLLDVVDDLTRKVAELRDTCEALKRHSFGTAVARVATDAIPPSVVGVPAAVSGEPPAVVPVSHASVVAAAASGAAVTSVPEPGAAAAAVAAVAGPTPPIPPKRGPRMDLLRERFIEVQREIHRASPGSSQRHVRVGGAPLTGPCLSSASTVSTDSASSASVEVGGAGVVVGRLHGMVVDGRGVGVGGEAAEAEIAVAAEEV
ncbi:hypothetical protein HDU96_010901 [Phlyctochytrium bullatum]|nr:hypothetical protein HDU96_010901 [Phlyctochytrium bullatum]